LDSLKGAAAIMDVKDHPIPDTKLFKKLATYWPRSPILQFNLGQTPGRHVTCNLGAMVKAAKAMKTKRADADLSAQTMLTEGLGDTIG
jgi:hypothetical protein